MSNKKVDIVVVNWNAGEKVLHAITPYFGFKNEIISCNVIVVDNASSDESLKLLKSSVNKLIANCENLGFGKACNQAFKECQGDYVLLLNPDTISKVEVLENLVQFLESNSEYGIVGPLQLDSEENVLRTCGRFPTFKTSIFDVLGLSKLFPYYFTPAPIMKDWDHMQSRDVDHVMGSYFLLKRPLLERTGLMDEDYFVYFEDLDLSKRIIDAGYKTFFNNKYSIIHQAGGTGDKAEDKRLFYSLSSRRIYWKKHFNKAACFTLIFLSVTVEPVLRIMEVILGRKKFSVKKIAKAYYNYFKKI
jgi:GT2 family glycosyltransferase